MYIFKYAGENTKRLTTGREYIGRNSKAGDIMIRDDFGRWTPVFIKHYAYNRIWKFIEIVSKFHVRNHKEAINFPNKGE